MQAQKVSQRMKQIGGSDQSLGRQDFDLSPATANEDSLVAELKADVPLAIRENAAARIAFTTGEEFTTDGTAGNTETFSLSFNAVDTRNATSFLLYDDGAIVQPDAVDYSANSFDFTDGGTGSTLHAFYLARDPGAVRVEKVAPKAGGQVSEDLLDDATSALVDRDQNKEPPEFQFSKPFENVVPANWKLQVYVDAPAPVRWDDSNLTTSNGDVAMNAVLTIPIFQFADKVEGLSDAVKASALGLEG